MSAPSKANNVDVAKFKSTIPRLADSRLQKIAYTANMCKNLLIKSVLVSLDNCFSPNALGSGPYQSGGKPHLWR